MKSYNNSQLISCFYYEIEKKKSVFYELHINMYDNSEVVNIFYYGTFYYLFTFFFLKNCTILNVNTNLNHYMVFL